MRRRGAGPWLARLLLRLCLSRAEREVIVGDLEEVWARGRARGERGRRLRYWRNALGSIVARAGRRGGGRLWLAVAGRTIAINGGSFTVVGVAGGGFRGVSRGYDVDVWVPARAMGIILSGQDGREPLRLFSWARLRAPGRRRLAGSRSGRSRTGAAGGDAGPSGRRRAPGREPSACSRGGRPRPVVPVPGAGGRPGASPRGGADAADRVRERGERAAVPVRSEARGAGGTAHCLPSSRQRSALPLRSGA